MVLVVLAVCTGNICRSPAVEHLLGQRLDGSVAVSSAGTGALVGEPVSPPMARLLVGDGVDPTGFRARQLTAGQVEGADLVLALTAAHRAQILELYPAALRRTFTLLELGRLAGAVAPGVNGAGGAGVGVAGVGVAASAPGDDAARLRALLPLAVAERPRFAAQALDDDIADPYGRSDAAYLHSFQQIERAVDQLVGALRA